MASCSRCGELVTFRYVGGRCVPIHPLGPCSALTSNSSVNDFAGYQSSAESSCFQTECPTCGDRVFFIRHNGGSVWIDSPLGPPWNKHRCMDEGVTQNSSVQNSLSSEYDLPQGSLTDGVLVGVVTEAETSIESETTLINVQAGEKDDFLILVKNKAGFLVGKIVAFDAACTFVRWIENEMYSFSTLAFVRAPKTIPNCENQMIECPVCGVEIKSKNLAKHFRSKHQFMML